MSCCNCFGSGSAVEDSAERQPLLQPVSARQFPPGAKPNSYEKTGPRGSFEDTPRKTGTFSPKRVGVPDIDQPFADIADTFNKQQVQYNTMTMCLRNLKESYTCCPEATFTDCIQYIMNEHNAYQPSFHMKGYDFSLSLSADAVPDKLQQAQDWVKNLGQAAKTITSTCTKLQQMIGWVVQHEEDFMRQVRESTPAFMDQQRVEANLREDLKEVLRIQEQSKGYRVEAGALLQEVAQLAGVRLSP